jgi:hypothetical protein
MFKKNKWDNFPNSADKTIPKGLLLLYLIPIFGCFPALWTLYHQEGNREQMSLSRISISLAATWLLVYMLLTTGSATSEFLMLRLLILNSLLTSGYFLVSIWLIFQVLQGKSVKLPVFSRLGANLLRR